MKFKYLNNWEVFNWLFLIYFKYIFNTAIQTEFTKSGRIFII